MATEIYKKVIIKDEEYSIKKFDAKTGLKLARLVLSKAQPLVALMANADNETDGATGIDTYRAAFSILQSLSDEDIDDLVDKCLRVCSKMLPGGPCKILDATGHYGVDGVEYDVGLTLMLCYEAIKWGASDFFGENSSISSLFKQSVG